MRWLFRLIGILASLAVLGVVAILLLPQERLANLAAEQITRLTGRQVVMTGGLKPSFYPQIGITTGRVEVASADWAADQGPIFAADGLSVGVDLRALIGGEIRVGQIEAVAPAITLIKAADGRMSWQSGATTSPATQGDAARRQISLDSLTVTDARLRYIDRAAGTDVTLTGITLTATLPDAAGALDFDLSARQGATDLSAKGQIGNFTALMDGASVPVEVAFKAGKATASFAGQAATNGNATGRLTADLSDLAAVTGLVGASAPDLPGGWGNKITVEGRLDAALPIIALDDARLTVGPNSLTGTATVDLGGTRPRLSGDFQTGTLDLSALTKGNSAPEPAEGKGWPTDRIDASALGALDAAVSLSASAVDLGDIDLGTTRLRIAIDAARAVLTLTEVQGFGGSLTGELVANNRAGLSVGGNLSANSVILQDLLGSLMGFERLRGEGAAQLSFLGVGNSLDAIMRSLSGKASLSVGKGELTGINLAALFGGANNDKATTIFDTLAASFAIDKGIAKNSDLRIAAPLFRADGKGQIDLGGQAIDYTVTPAVFRGEGDGGIKVPVRIIGPWSSPRIYPDLEALAQERLDEERARLEAEARQKLEDEAAKAIGVELEEGQTLEDAAKKKLEDELLKGLGGLLGGN